MWFLLAKGFSFIYGICHDRFGINLRGIGFFLGHIRSDHVLAVEGLKMFMSASVASCYVRNITGRFNEPEVHTLLQHVISAFRETLLVVDVGANVGEIVTDAARYPNVREVIGFEPNRACAEACKRSAELNGFRNVRIVNKAVSIDSKPTTFYFSENALTSSLLAMEDRQGEIVETTSLDLELAGYSGESIVVIDVEGAEKLVMLGGKQFIERNHPLLVFEYNHVTRRFCSLEEINQLLGGEYSIFRLRSDGLLDRVLEHTWNCVAVHRRSPYYPICVPNLLIPE